jgi:hypothetical protein
LALSYRKPTRAATALTIKVNKEEILHDYKQKPGAFIPEFVALDNLAEIYLNNPGFHSSFEDFMDEWQEEDNAVECEF